MDNGKFNLKKSFYILHFTFYIFIFGCATKTTPVYAVIDTPFVKAADQGFLEKGFNYKKLIIYKDASVPVEFTIYKNSVCLNKKCVSKNRFIKKLSPGYPKNLIDKIIEKKPIQNLGKIIKLKKGFLQKNERFYYLVTKKKVLFKDKKKKILIMIKEIK
ncbi:MULTISPECIES: hypothetical protein [unclassified Lebetimonas]|uniref:hypothetical protein n=1 Tax=unclassified Lebetimonas TaxID=2648158 RepID=UPI0004634B42|nr:MULTISPECIES: hypothetical protein [unclassified Lebetimonas]